MKERGLSIEGLKGDLINRLEAYLEEQEFALPGEGDLPPTPTGAAMTTVEELPMPAPALETAAVEETKEVKPVKKAASVETEKEKAIPGTEPSPAPVVPPEPTPAAASNKPTAEITGAEKMAARAARFGIPLVEPKKPQSPSKKRGPQRDNKKGSNKKQKKQGGDSKQQQGGNKEQKKNTSQKKETPLLSVEEIEKRLKRAEKFGTGDNAQTQELKAMLRKHRFAAGST